MTYITDHIAHRGIITPATIDWLTSPSTSISPYSTITSVTLTGAQVQPKTPSIVDAFKPKRAGKNKSLSHIVFVLDDSSSMYMNRTSTIAGYNEFLNAQREDAKATGIATLVSLYKFNGNSVVEVFSRENVEEVKPLEEKDYNPRGNTNLLDAMGGVMMQINTMLADKKKSERESVIIAILTDGEENASRTFDNSDVKGMVEKAEGKSWGFMFMGANIDAFHASSKLGFNYNNTMQFNTANVGETMRSLSSMTSRMKTAYAAGAATSDAYVDSGFTAVERSAAVGASENDSQ